MIGHKTVILALSALTVVSAQQATYGNWSINAGSIPLATRAQWCGDEKTNCDQLCFAPAPTNDCDPATLNFKCTCSNGTAPGLQYYTNTIPYYICAQAFQDCIKSTDSASAQQGCINNIQKKCGSLNPANAASGGSTSSSSSVSSSASATAAASSSAASAAAASTSTSRGGAMPTAAAQLGNGAAVVAAGLFAYML